MSIVVRVTRTYVRTALVMVPDDFDVTSELDAAAEAQWNNQIEVGDFDVTSERVEWVYDL